jgi:hypothetical protein
MLLVGYCFGIRSERRLCDEVHLNLAYRWFCRLGLEDRVPDHTTFALNRHGRFRDSGAFRLVFESVVRRCMAAALLCSGAPSRRKRAASSSGPLGRCTRETSGRGGEPGKSHNAKNRKW